MTDLPDQPTPAPLPTCEHPEFSAKVDVTRLSEREDGPITGYTADVAVRCARCNEPFEFIGLPIGYNPRAPTVSFDGIEARMPLREHFGFAAVEPAPPVALCSTTHVGYGKCPECGLEGEAQLRPPSPAPSSAEVARERVLAHFSQFQCSHLLNTIEGPLRGHLDLIDDLIRAIRKEYEHGK